MKNKKTIGIIIALLIVIIVIVLVICLSNKPKEKKVLLEDNDIEIKLNKLGKIYYKNYFYKAINKEKLKDYSDTGISISIYNLEKYKDSDQEFNKEFTEDLVNSINEYKCNKDTSIVIITPKDPYGENDYTVEVYLECDN